MRPTAIVSEDGFSVDTSRIKDWDTATIVAASISSAGSGATWALGDICNHLADIRKTDPRKRVRTMRAFATSINQPYDTLRTAARTARYVPHQIRRMYGSLTYGHFREIVRKGYTELDDITLWAERAHNNGWGVGALKDHLYGTTPEGSDAKRTARRINQLAPGIYADGLDAIPLEELRLLADNALRISSLVRDFLQNADAERRKKQPAAVAAQPLVRAGGGESSGGGPHDTPRAPGE